MNNDFSLREEILSVTQRWPIIVAFGFAGILLGLVTALFWPAQYQANKALHVGLNVYQIAEDPGVSGVANPQFHFADDYKNWQMANLDNVIYMDSVLDATLAQLRSLDDYWNQVNREQLSDMLNAYWRNAGKWNLVATHADQKFAAQAVEVWEDSIIEKVHSSVQAAQKSLLIDLELRAVLDAQVQAISQMAVFEEYLAALESWQATVHEWPGDQPIDQGARQEILQQCNQILQTLEGSSLLETCPAAESPTETYQKWLDRTILALNQQIQVTQAQLNALETQKDSLAEEYAKASGDSLGLSANLVVEKITTSPPSTTRTRPTSTLVFIGGLLGLIAWGLVWIAKIALARKPPTISEEQA